MKVQLTQSELRGAKIELAGGEVDDLMARNFLEHLYDNGFLRSNFRHDTCAVIKKFLRSARKTLKYKTVTCTQNCNIIGTSGCQLYNPPYPIVFPDDYMSLGYIWGVFVDRPYRGNGIGTLLIGAAVDYLKSEGCTRVLLHASPFGRSMYERIGFVQSDEMKLNLNEQNDT